MARTEPNPDELIAVLEADQARIEGERDAASRALMAAREELGDTGPRSIRNRQREMLLAEARGRPGELPQVLAADTAAAHVAVQASAVKVEALAAAIGEISAEIEVVRDGAIEYFARRAHAASVAALEAQETARAAIVAAHEAWKAADGLWGRVRTSRRRLSYPDLPTGPVADLGTLSRAFELACERPPWPAGQRPRSDEDLAHAWRDVDYPASFGKAAPVPS